jgi:hypothetical protein
MNFEMCAQCKELLDRAASAITVHLRAVSRLELAHHRHEDDLIPALELATQQESLERENAVETYKSHIASHDASKKASA